MEDKDQPYQRAIEKAAQLAYQYEMKYFGCSQTVLAALMESFGIGGPDILRAASTFAGGVARRGTACGSLAGGLIMIGFLAGRDDLEMSGQYQRGMHFADKLCQRFEEVYGTVVYRDIQKIKFGRSFDLLQEDEREKLHAAMTANPDGCQAVAGDAAQWAAQIVAEILQQGPPLARMLARAKSW
ncbi:MAG: C_GCAxxG_C_C family protein [Desulfobacterales bacterium]|nr:MAG: C_GCAxxG_C_C family protein [Desulfobacterales bacterium]